MDIGAHCPAVDKEPDGEEEGAEERGDEAVFLRAETVLDIMGYHVPAQV
jgi:hypothetical protein